MVHPSAIIHKSAVISDGVRIGPYSVIGENVTILPGTILGPHVVIEGECLIGERCVIYPHTVIGTPPQDMKYKGEKTRLEIGSGCVIREFVSINRGTKAGGGETIIGDDCYFMANSHVAHDCNLENNVVLANSVALAGHVFVGKHACFGGLAGVHQFARIGAYSFLGAGAMIRRDIPPFTLARGDRAVIYSLNHIGLERHGFDKERINKIQKMYDIIVRAGVERGNKKLKEMQNPTEDASMIIDFIDQTKLGISLFKD